jgi:ribosomal protein S27AE
MRPATDMRRVACPECGVVLDEADERWDVASSTGSCPRCGSVKLYPTDLDRSPDPIRIVAPSPKVQKVVRLLMGVGFVWLGLDFVGTRTLPVRAPFEPVTGLPAVIAGAIWIGLGIYVMLPTRKRDPR